MNIHEMFMRKALEQAKTAFEIGEVPVGCVIICQERVIAQQFNLCHTEKNPLLHAEILAIQQACKQLHSYSLKNCALYVTLEPCAMCAGAIIHSQISQVFFGTRDVCNGACGSVLNLFEENFGHHPKLIGGLLEQECSQILSDFFKQLRH